MHSVIAGLAGRGNESEEEEDEVAQAMAAARARRDNTSSRLPPADSGFRPGRYAIGPNKSLGTPCTATCDRGTSKDWPVAWHTTTVQASRTNDAQWRITTTMHLQGLTGYVN